MNYLVTCTTETLVIAHLTGDADLSKIGTVLLASHRIALKEGRPVPLRVIINCIPDNFITHLSLILPEGSEITVQEPRKFNLPLIQQFVDSQKKGQPS